MVASDVYPTEDAVDVCLTEDDMDVCPTEDAIHAFLDCLVDPMLPAKSSLRDTLSQSQKQSMAKQVHAVVLLYNYYHRKQQQHLTFEGFESFCKLAVVMRPALLTHLKLMQRSDDSELNDLGKQISLTEKAVMDACDIAKTLDASKDVPNTEGWPISKVVIFLIDARKENCFLQFSSITQGVWSMIEKDVNASSCISEGVMEGKHKAKKIKVTKRPVRGELSADELCFQQLAFSAVKEVTGFNKCDLTILGSNVVYSLSKEKTAARFYMMQSTQPKKDDKIEIPIKDVIDSLQGPLLVRNSHQWMVTSVVEYFHLLPCAGIVSEWFCRGVLSNDLQDQKMGLASINVIRSKIKEEPYEPEICNNQDGSPIDIDGVEFIGSSSDFDTKPQQTDKNGSCTDRFGDCDGSQSMNLDACCLVCPQNEEKSKNIDPRVQIDDHQRKSNSCWKTDSNGTAGVNIEAEMIGSMRMPFDTETGGVNSVDKKATCDTIYSDPHEMPIGDGDLVSHQSNSKDLENPQNTVASKENILSQTALRVLFGRRNKLILQQRNIEDEIALCNKRIQTLLNGGKDDLVVKIESVLEGCDDMCPRSLSQERSWHLENHCSPKSIKMMRLSEAVLNKQNSCQELDDISYENDWILPTYQISSSDGGFHAEVTVKGKDFDCSSSGDLRFSPQEARQSAATQILAKLRYMASESK